MIETPRRIAPLAAVLVSWTVLTVAPTAGRAQAPAETGGDSQPVARGAGKFGIGTIGPATLPADLRIKLEDAAAAGLVASGARVVTAGDLARARAGAGLGSCADSVCERRLAQITDTRTWLRGTCQLDTSTYRLHLELVDAASGAVLAARDDTCDICTEADAADLANVAASALKAKLAPAPLLAAPTNAPAAPATAPTLAGAAAGQSPGAASRPAWQRALPWVAFAGAAAAIAGGAYYLSMHNDETDCADRICYRLKDTLLWPGLPLLGLGAALAGTGVILLRLRPPSPAAASEARARPSALAGLGSPHVILSPRAIGVGATF